MVKPKAKKSGVAESDDQTVHPVASASSNVLCKRTRAERDGEREGESDEDGDRHKHHRLTLEDDPGTPLISMPAHQSETMHALHQAIMAGEYCETSGVCSPAALFQEPEYHLYFAVSFLCLLK